jgi:probable phosphoglycerate mutase
MSEKATATWSPPARRRVYLMRHGEVDYFDAQGRPFRPEGVPLNAEGRRQAAAAAAALAGVPLDRAVTSGLRRSTETAALVVAARRLPIEERPELREIETGRLSQWGAAPADEVEQLFLGALSCGVDDATRFLAGETFGSLRGRVVPCFQALLAEPGWRHLLVVAHGVVNRVLLSWVLHGGLAGLGGFEQDAGCINVLDVGPDGRCLLRLVNYTPADPLKAGMELTTMEQLYLQYCRGRERPRT